MGPNPRPNASVLYKEFYCLAPRWAPVKRSVNFVLNFLFPFTRAAGLSGELLQLIYTKATLASKYLHCLLTLVAARYLPREPIPLIVLYLVYCCHAQDYKCSISNMAGSVIIAVLNFSLVLCAKL